MALYRLIHGRSGLPGAVEVVYSFIIDVAGLRAAKEVNDSHAFDIGCHRHHPCRSYFVSGVRGFNSRFLCHDFGSVEFTGRLYTLPSV